MKKGSYSLSSSKGFTLIELLIVVAIIGILATVVILNVSSARTKAMQAKVQEESVTIAKAFEVLKTTGGSIANVGSRTDFCDEPVKSAYDTNPEGLNGFDMSNIKDDTGQSLLPSTITHPMKNRYYFFYLDVATKHFGLRAPLENDSTDDKYVKCNDTAACVVVNSYVGDSDMTGDDNNFDC